MLHKRLKTKQIPDIADDFTEIAETHVAMTSFSPAQSPTLLITDDDPAFRETLRDVFEPEGFQTFLAEDGLEAFQIVLAKPVHLVLLDMHMPRLDGVETIRRVHEIKPELPCILLSAALDEMVIKAAEEVFAFSVLAKPCTRQQITSVVRSALRSTYSF